MKRKVFEHMQRVVMDENLDWPLRGQKMRRTVNRLTDAEKERIRPSRFCAVAADECLRICGCGDGHRQSLATREYRQWRNSRSTEKRRGKSITTPLFFSAALA